jgi:hypothetical protein
MEHEVCSPNAPPFGMRGHVVRALRSVPLSLPDGLIVDENRACSFALTVLDATSLGNPDFLLVFTLCK